MATAVRVLKVYGNVSDAQGNKLPGLLVRAFDRDLRNEQPLGESVTNSDGYYEISYTAESFHRAEKRNADLSVKVFSRSGRLLYEPAMENIVFNAPAEVAVHITISTAIAPEENEFDAFVRTLTPLLENTPVSALQENSQLRDITFLQRETGLDGRKLEYLALAHRLGEETRIDPAFFYALFRKNTVLKLDLAQSINARLQIDINTETKPLLYDIALADEKLIQQDVLSAIKEMIIPARVQEQLRQIMALLKRLTEEAKNYQQNERQRLTVNLVGNFILSDRLAALPEIVEKTKHDPTALFNTLSGPEFFRSDADESQARANLLLAQVLGFNKQIIRQVKDKQRIKKPGDLKKLATIDRSGWRDLLRKSVKDDGTGQQEMENEVLDFHASLLVREMEKQYPSAAFAAQLKREKNASLNRHKDMVKLFGDHDDFDLEKTNVEAFFRDKNLDKPENASLKNELKSVQRMFKLVPHYGKTNALLKEKMRSAQSIVAAGETRFVNEIAPKAGLSKTEAKAVYQRAENTNIATMLIAGELLDLRGSMEVEVLKTTSLETTLSAVSKDFPNISSLFKLTDICACEHCRSVYSPAAYLVEILQFLDKRTVVDLTTTPPTAARLAKDVLFERRPDLGDIDLGCENANTPLPYIDLVCELLEEVVSPDPGTPFNGTIAKGKISNALLTALTAAKIPVTDKALLFEPDVNGDVILRDQKLVGKIINTGVNTWNVKVLHQTLASAEELAAAPEYINLKAYDDLKNSKFAFRLPFNLHHTEATAYFSRFDISRAQLMLDFQAGGTPADENIAAEKLGLTEEERALIVTPDNANQQLYWNTAPATAVDAMKVVGHFLDKSGLTYKELEALLHLKFINPNDKLFIKHLDTSCDTTKKEINDLDNDALDRLHRFLRLLKKTGWMPEVLDEVIRQPRLGNGTLDNNCLIIMANLLRVKEKTGIKLEELIGFYGEIPHTEIPGSGKKTLYQNIFLNKATSGFIEEGLLPEKIDGTKQLADFATTLALSVQLSAQDFDKLIASFSNTDLTFENLSLLYAVSRLSRRLKLKTEDYFLFKDLTGLDVFSSPAVTLAFIEHIEKGRTSPLKIADVQFMLRHEAANLGEREISGAKITDLLQNLQAAYQKAFDANRSPFDASLKADELKETVKNLLSKLPQATPDAADEKNITEDDIKNFLRMIDRQWTSPPDPVAATYIDSKLSSFFDTTDIKNKQNALATAVPPTPDYDFESERMDLIGSMLAALSAYFYKTEKTNALLGALATTFKTDDDVLKAVLTYAKLKQPAPGTARISDLLLTDAFIDQVNIPPVPPAITAAAFPDQFRAIKLLHKLIPLMASLKLDVPDTEWLFTNAASLGWLELDSIPYEAGQTPVAYSEWEELLEIISFTKKYTPVPDPADAEKPVTFFTVLERLIPGAGTTRNQWLDALALLTGYDREQLDEMDLYFGYSVPDVSAYTKPATWLRIETGMEHLRRLGVTVDQAKEFIKASLTADDTHRLRMALKTRYDETLWLETLKEIMDSIRPQKRNALVAYVMATHPDMKTENDLFDYLLVDVEMEACMPSSRIVQAHGSIQLFVQRCLLGLEPKAAADAANDKGWEQWKWMRNYRVWEANRKVFLYPENWIEPELLDDKSYLFSDLENELLQNEVNEFTTEEALITYLERLDDIAFLEPVALYEQTDIYTMHVFARTKGGDPATYYYRTFEKERYWTPWKKVDLDITGDHLLAFVRNNRLCLAWPVFSEVPDPDPQGDVPDINNPGTKPVAKPKRKLKIQLAISEFANNKWKPKKVSRQGIETPNYFTSDAIPRNIYNLLYSQFTEQILVFHTQAENNIEYHTLDGIFNITGCKGYPELASTTQSNFPDFFPDFKDSLLAIQRYTEMGQDGSNDLSVRNALSFFNFYLLLRETPGTFRLTYPHQFTLIDLVALFYQLLMQNANGTSAATHGRGRGFKLPLGTLLPYFFEDSVHGYVVIPGFYGRDKEDDNGQPVVVKRTYSDVLKLVEDIIALYIKYMKKLQDDPNHDVQALLQQLIADPEYQRIVAELKVYQDLRYGEEFKNMYHPLLCMLRKTLYKDGVPALMKRETQLFTNTNFNFNNHYAPNSALIPSPFPVEDLDFSSDGSYSGYNWELFYHVPLLLATRLSKNQRFEEALTWFHYMFNPTGALEGTVPQKFWVTKPFYLRQTSEYIAQRIDTLLTKIADPTTPARKELEFAIDQWRTKPFRPHVVARFRSVAYQKTLLMKYIDNLIEWGDNLFRQDTMETVTQATQMYILADKLLGPKPRMIPPAVKVPYQTYNQLEAGLDAFGNALVEFENLLPDLSVLPHGGAELPPPPITLSSLYFCIPPNDKMLEYWDRIEDRLFKIRHCQNIEGVERTLALFAPPIDPGMLVRAAAAGLDISSVLAGLNAPLPHYRFAVQLQKATELAQEIRTLGNALQQALEKKDAEALLLLRGEMEIKVLKAVRDVRKQQIAEAREQIEVLKRTQAVTEERNVYYTNIKKIIANEQLHLDKLKEANTKQEAAQGVQLGASLLALIPDIDIGASGFGGSPIAKFKFGGLNLAQAAKAASDVLSFLSLMASNEAVRASILGGFDRRQDDWKFQERVAKKELKQIEQQITAAQIRQEIAETELKNHDLQIENAQKTDEFMRGKYTNRQLYEWMIGKVSSVYFRAYQLAFDVAKKAEKCYQHELGATDNFLQFGYWDSLKKGLQSADHLLHDIKRMEVSYYDKNRREYELTKHVSLALLDPLALVRLKATGSCDFQVPEAVYDMDHPGQYFRRIKSVSITIPCIAGPYTSVSCKLSLVSNKYRKNTAKTQGAATPKEEYEEATGNDERFTYNVGAIQSVAASHAQNDSGLFELNFREERYLPFEGCGAISTWRLDLPKEVRQFDYNTISDILLHIKYTAREGGSTLRLLAESTLKETLNEVKQQVSRTGLHLSLNMRFDLSNEWHALKTNGAVNLRITKDRLPYFAKALDAEIDSVLFIGRIKNNPASFTINVNAAAVLLNRVDAWKLCMGVNNTITLDTPFDLSVAAAQLTNLEDLVIVVKYVFT